MGRKTSHSHVKNPLDQGVCLNVWQLAHVVLHQDSTCHAGACLGLVPAAMSSFQALSQTFMPTFHDVPEYVPVCKAAKRYLLSFTRAFLTCLAG